ncbi:MAG: protein kinase, partial [Actinobacteria bacterium]|nr:protein kinase [Actinomycetota bacterium]
MTADATIVSGRRVADRYRLVSERADGSWDAVDETLKRDVVVCLLSALAAPEAKAHFTAEARALAGLNHRNVVATFDTGLDGDGSSYRVDELAGGEPLDTGAVKDDLRVSFATQIARAVADAHARDLVHGSLTSGDVLVNDEGRVKVRGLKLPTLGAEDELRKADLDAVTNLVAALAPAAASPLR